MKLSILDLLSLAWTEAFLQFLISDRFLVLTILQNRVLYFAYWERCQRISLMTATVPFFKKSFSLSKLLLSSWVIGSERAKKLS